jgi:hypothetical protein
MKQRKEKVGSREIFCKMQATEEEEEEGEEQWPRLVCSTTSSTGVPRTNSNSRCCVLAHQMDDQGKGM